MSGRRRAARVPEKAEQQHIIATLRTVGAVVYTVGTRRPSGDYQGTCQTPGIPDLLAFVPDRRPLEVRHGAFRLLCIEVKAEGGSMAPAQKVFRDLCVGSSVDHVVGGLDAVIAWLIEAGALRRDQVPHYRLPKGAVA